MEGLLELAKFVQEGGALITEGSTAALMAEYDLGGGVTVEHPADLFARGSILRGTFADLKSPIAYGYDGKDLPVYFNQDPVLNAGAGGGGFGGGFGGGGGGGGRGGADANAQNITPNSALLSNITPLDPDNPLVPAAPAAGGGGGRGGRGGRGGGGRGGAAAAPARQPPAQRQRPADRWWRRWWRGGRGGRGGAGAEDRARVILQFPSDPSKMLLSGTLDGGETLANRAAGGGCAAGQGPHRDVRAASLLALADAGNVLPGVQRDPELGSSGCREGCAGGGGDRCGRTVGRTASRSL